MKRLITVSFLAILATSISNVVFAEEVEELELEKTEVETVVVPPKWTDFCEVGYEKVQYKNKNDILDIFSCVKSERMKNNYWAERRNSFEKYLKSCEALEGEAKNSCYVDLTKSEKAKNDLYKQTRKELLYENTFPIHRR